MSGRQSLFEKNGRPISKSLRTTYLHYYGFSVNNPERKRQPFVFSCCRITVTIFTNLIFSNMDLRITKTILYFIWYRQQVVIPRTNPKFYTLIFHLSQRRFRVQQLCHILFCPDMPNSQNSEDLSEWSERGLWRSFSNAKPT